MNGLLRLKIRRMAMKKNLVRNLGLLVIGIAACLAIGMARAQTVPPASTVPVAPVLAPFDPTPIVVALASQTAWTDWAGLAITRLGQNQAADEAKLNALSDQAAAISALQANLAADETAINVQQAAIAALTARVTALEGKVATAGTALAKP
jgi:uncharacterized coiled-coil protein SlyX